MTFPLRNADDKRASLRLRRASDAGRIGLRLCLPAAPVLPIAINEKFGEEKESGRTLRDLRHRYLEGLEKYVTRLTTEGGRREDADRIKRETADAMRTDLAKLKSELGSAKRDVLLSKEIIITALAAAGSVASWAFGVPIPIAGTITAAGIPAALLGTGVTANKYVATRRAVMEKHSMEYLYELSR